VRPGKFGGEPAVQSAVVSLGFMQREVPMSEERIGRWALDGVVRLADMCVLGKILRAVGEAAQRECAEAVDLTYWVRSIA
jgi:hypothetical protein